MMEIWVWKNQNFFPPSPRTVEIEVTQYDEQILYPTPQRYSESHWYRWLQTGVQIHSRKRVCQWRLAVMDGWTL